MAYNVNYNDARFTQVEEDRKEALTENEKMYGGMISDSDKYYQAQIDASKEWADKQTQLQQEKTDFAIEQIEQQKEQARKDYIKEQSGAYTDWQKQSNQYGSNAEQMAENGLAHTGYSESSQVSMFNTYQNRVASARESFGRAVLEYDNAMKDARLQNNSILAEIAFESLQKSLELSLQGFQYKNQLLTEKVNQKNIINNRFDTKWQNVLDQINTENALAEEVRQYNANHELQLKQSQEEQRQFNIENAPSGGYLTGSGSKDAIKRVASNPKKATGKLTSNGSVSGSNESSGGGTPKATGVTLGSVIKSDALLKQLGFNSNSRIYSMDGNFYVKTSKGYVDMTSQLRPLMHTLGKFGVKY